MLNLCQKVAAGLGVPDRVGGSQCTHEALDMAEWCAQLVRGCRDEVLAGLVGSLSGLVQTAVLERCGAAARDPVGQHQVATRVSPGSILGGDAQRAKRVTMDTQRHDQHSPEADLARRRYSAELKSQVMAECDASGASVAKVGR